MVKHHLSTEEQEARARRELELHNQYEDFKRGATVKEVLFLTPAKITVQGPHPDGEKTHIYKVLVDIVNRKVCDQDYNEMDWLTAKVFQHIDEVNTLPEDFFIAPQEVTDQAEQAQKSYDAMQEQTLGVASE